MANENINKVDQGLQTIRFGKPFLQPNQRLDINLQLFKLVLNPRSNIGNVTHPFVFLLEFHLVFTHSLVLI